MRGGPLDRQRPAADHDEDDRRAGRDDGLEQLLLPPDEAEVPAVPELPRRRIVGQPGSFAEDDDRDVGASGDRDRLRDLVVRPVVQPGATRIQDLGRRQARGDRIEDRLSTGQFIGRDDLVGQVEAEGIPVLAHLRERLHVEQVRVIAQQVAGARRDRPDDRHTAQVRGERQDPVVLHEDDRSPRERLGDPRLVCGKVGHGGRFGQRDHGLLEESQSELHTKRPLHREVEERSVDPPVSQRLQQRLAVGDRARQLGVDARPQAQRGGRAQVTGQLVLRGEHLDPGVVGGDDAVEAPLVAQDRGQQLVRGMARHAVDVAVGGHDARQADPGRRPRTGRAARRASRAARGGPAPG